MKYLSNNALIDAYKKAVKMELDKDFLELLTNEINTREIDLYNVNEVTGDGYFRSLGGINI